MLDGPTWDLMVKLGIIDFMDEMKGNVISSTTYPEIIVAATLTQFWTSFNISGDCTGYIVIHSDEDGTAGLIDAAGTITNNYLILQDVTGSTGTFTANNSINDGNVTNWTVNEPASAGYVYWIGNTGVWSDPLNWSTGCVPGPQDTIVFDASSFTGTSDVVTVDINGYGYSMIWNGVTGNPIFAGNIFSIYLRNSLTLDATMSYNFQGEIEFNGATGTGSITSNGVVLNGNIRVDGLASWQLIDNLTSNADFILEEGTFSSNNQDISVAHFNTDYTNTRVLNMESSSYYMTSGDNETFVVDGSNLTLNEGTSEIIFNTSATSTAHFNGNSQTYNNLRLQNSSVLIGGGNTFNIVEINPGTSVTIENMMTQNIDSLIANGTCDNTISISAYSNSATPPEINKTGYDTLIISYVNLNHVTATNTLPKYNLAQNSTIFNTTTGWDTTDVTRGNDYYWRGNTGNWSNISNWESPLGTPATCLPNITDTVYFDPGSFSALNDIVTVDIDAFCAKMDWTGSQGLAPIMSFDRNLTIRQNAILNSSVSFTNNNAGAAIKFLPKGNNCSFETFEASIDVDILLDGSAITDILTLQGDLKIAPTSELYISEGTFNTNGDSITCGSFIVESTSAKELFLNDSYIQISTTMDFDGTHILNAGTSEISIGYNNDYSIFYGGDKTYYNVTLNGSNNSVSDLTGTNTYNNLTLLAGIRLRVEASQVQNVNGNFEAIGLCPNDSIFIYSDVPVTATSINCASTPTIEVTNLTNITASGLIIDALFSTDNGSNTNINFIATPATTANYTRTFDVCLGSAASFTNTSTAFSGGIPSLTFEWDLGDGNSSTAIDPTYTYLSSGIYDIELTSTYTNGCSHTYLDSVRVNDAEIFYSTSESDTTICQGDSVTFYISSPGASNFDFLVNSATVQSGTIEEYGTKVLNDGNIIQVEVTLNTCPKLSDPIVMNVIDLPVISVATSVPSNTICEGETITFTASGADQYQFYIDGNAQGSYSNTNTFSVSDLTNGQIVTVEGKDTVTKCNDISVNSYTVTVNPLPIPSFTTSEPSLIICQGDPVIFTGTGASEYEFFVNGFSQQGPSTATSFSSNTLNNSDIVTMEGTSSGCTSVSGDNYVYFVNPIPIVTSTNSSIGNIACDQDVVTITADGASNYEFFVNGGSVFGPTGSTTYSTDALVNGDIITVTGNLNNCLSSSPPETFVINANPTVTLTSSDADNTICFEEGITFTGAGASNYEFFIDGVSSQGPIATSTYFTDSILNGQTISVIGTDNNCLGSGDFTYQFNVNPPFTVNFYCSDIDQTICEGESIDFTAIGSGVTQYDLYIDGNLETSNSTGLFTLSTLNAGTFLITVHGLKGGCYRTSSTSFTVTVNPIPAVSLSSSIPTNTICSGDSVYYIGSGALEYEFFVDGFTQGALSSTDSILTTSLLDGQTITLFGASNGCSAYSPTDITVAVTAVPTTTISSSDIDNIVCEGESILYTGSGGALYEFSVNGSVVQSLSATDTYSILPTNGDIITVIANQNSCNGNDASINITVNSAPVITSSISDADTSICAGESIVVSADGASTYEFFIDGNSMGAASINNSFSTSSISNGETITISGSSNFGCQANSLNIYTWEVIPLPTVASTSTDADGTICNGDVVIFDASGADSINFYLDGIWLFDGINYSTDSISNGQTISIDGYSNGCSSTTSTNYPFTVYNYPIAGISTDIINNELCTGDTAIIIGHGGLTYEFVLEGSTVLGPGNQDSLILPNLNDGEIVYVNAINNGCVTQSNSLTFTVNTTPSVTFLTTEADHEICLGDNVTFTASGANEYEFFVNNNSQTGITSANSFSTSTLENAAYITVAGHNGVCNALSDSTYIFTVLTMDIDLTNNSNNVICSGKSVSFSANGADEYEFFVEGNSVQGPSTTNFYTNDNLTDGQVITVEGTNYTTGCVQESANSQLFVVLSNPVVSPAGPLSICEGNFIELTSNYDTWNQWYADAFEITGETNNLYSVDNSGTYSVNIGIGGDKEVWSVGNNSTGQLGDSTWSPSQTTLQTLGINNIVEVDAGLHYSIAIDTGGILYSWGENDFGQLGDGTFGIANYPNIINSNQFTYIAAGYHHVLSILSDSTVMSWGKNTKGQLGLGNTATTNFPTNISGVSQVIDIAAGENHSIALLSDGSVVTWGDNQFGQLGDGTLITKNSPINIGLNNIVDVAAGANHSFAIDIFGRLWAWGNNAKGQLGIGNNSFQLTPTLNGLIDVRLVDGGAEHSIAVKDNNNFYAWGSNQYGQLGDGSFSSNYTPKLISSLSGVEYAEAGMHNTFVTRTDNSVWTFGQNTDAQLGNENTNTLNSPTHIIAFSGAIDFAPSLLHTSYLASFEASCPSNNVVVTVEAATPVSIIDFDSLLASSQSGDSYQWYINGLAIIDGTGNGQSLVATSSGYYSVEVTYANGCTVTSEEFPYNIVGIDEIDLFNITFYPNPNNGIFYYNSNVLTSNYQMQILDIRGRTVKVIDLETNQGVKPIELTSESGMYFYRIMNKDIVIKSGKIVIEK